MGVFFSSLMATSKLQKLTAKTIKDCFGDYVIRENYRPFWMETKNGNRLELDIFIKNLDVAIEVQGVQHYIYTPFMHKSIANFEKRKKLDIEKRRLCKKYGIILYEIYSESDIEGLIESLKRINGTGRNKKQSKRYRWMKNYEAKHGAVLILVCFADNELKIYRQLKINKAVKYIQRKSNIFKWVKFKISEYPHGEEKYFSALLKNKKYNEVISMFNIDVPI